MVKRPIVRDRSVFVRSAPFLSDIVKRLEDLQTRYPQSVELETIGQSVEGRDIPMATVTEKDVPDEDKELVLVNACHHGDEEAGPIAALGLLEWLVTDEAKTTRKRQILKVIPCANVDGCENGSPLNANGVNLDKDYYIVEKTDENPEPAGVPPSARFGAPTQPESKAVWGIVEKYTPDAVVDLHAARGASQTWIDSHPHNEAGPDRLVHDWMVWEMNTAAECAGYPQRMQAGSHAGISEIRTLPDAAYNYCRSLMVYLEGNETTFTPEQIRESALVRLKRFLEFGNNRWRGEFYPGYPSRTVAGGDFYRLGVYGVTAEERRKSREKLWQDGWMSGEHLQIFQELPEQPDRLCVFFRKQLFGYYYWFLPGLTMTLRLPGAKVKEVVFSGQPLDEGEVDGYVTWDDICSTYVQIAMKEPPRTATVEVRYENRGENP